MSAVALTSVYFPRLTGSLLVLFKKFRMNPVDGHQLALLNLSTDLIKL